MNIKKGDNVIMLAGKDKGKTGKVTSSFPREEKVVVEGVNMVKKHRKSQGQEGGSNIISKSMPVHVSNVALVDPKTGKPTRIKITHKNEKRVRVSKKSGAEIQG